MVPSKEAVASRAYEMWEDAGRPADSAEKFWLLAEEELESRSYAEEDGRPLPDRAENDGASAASKLAGGKRKTAPGAPLAHQK